jgi:hypothetical protein
MDVNQEQTTIKKAPHLRGFFYFKLMSSPEIAIHNFLSLWKKEKKAFI